MIKKSIYITAITLSLCGMVVQCSKGEEEKIRETFGEMEEAARDNKILSIQKNISREYRDQYGNGYNEIMGQVAIALRMLKNSFVYTSNPKVEVDGEGALVVFKALIVQGENIKDIKDVLNLLNQEERIYADALRFEVGMKKEAEGWKVSTAEWTPIKLLEVISFDN